MSALLVPMPAHCPSSSHGSVGRSSGSALRWTALQVDPVAPQSAALISSRVLSLGVFVALRLTCFQFFGFKRKYPHMAYCKDSKAPVDALEFASEDDLNRLDSDGAGGEVGLGGVKVRSPGEPPRTMDSLRRRP